MQAYCFRFYFLLVTVIILDGNSMYAINTFVGDGSKTWYGNGTGKAVRNDFICCRKSSLPSVVSCRVLDEVELSEYTRVDHRAFAVLFSQLHVSVSNQ